MSRSGKKVAAGEIARRKLRPVDVPDRVLLVDGDDLESHLLVSRLTAVGFDVELARDTAAAMAAVAARWYPLILLDRTVVDAGAEFVEQVRGRGGEDSFVAVVCAQGTTEIIARSSEIGRDAEASVDDFLSKKWPDAELRARLSAGLHTVALRRSLRESRAELAAQAARLEAGEADPDAKLQLLARLQSEAVRARRYKRSCSVLLMGVSAVAGEAEIDSDVQSSLLQALRGTIRLDIDAIALFASSPRHVQYAIVLPEAGPAEVSSIRHRVRTAVVQRLRERPASAGFGVSIGAASVDTGAEEAVGGAYAEAEKLLQSAQLCGECMASRGAQRLSAVQSSVVNRVSIPCRHGYAVADHCQELSAVSAERSAAMAASG